VCKFVVPALLDDAAVTHDEDPVCETGVLELVRHDDCHALGGDSLDLKEDLVLATRVEGYL
jgi:hypothetical protein